MKELEIRRNEGVYADTLLEFINYAKVPFKVIKHIENASAKQLDKKLRNNRAIITFMRHRKQEHVFFLTRKLRNKYECINFIGRKGKTISTVSLEQLQKMDLEMIVIERKL